jgi:hypothetical protein
MKFLNTILFLGFTVLFANLTFANSKTCEGLAQQKATANYFAEVGDIQGSEGPETFIEVSLKAKSPYFNYIVGIYDNNEDGETWTSYYFVMTKFENQTCSVLKVVATEEAGLKINAYYDFANDTELDQPQDSFLNTGLLKKAEPNFKVLIDQDNTICYVGDAQWVMILIQSILDSDNTDAAIIESNLRLINGVIVHQGLFTEGSGDNDSSLDFEIKACN